MSYGLLPYQKALARKRDEEWRRKEKEKEEERRRRREMGEGASSSQEFPHQEDDRYIYVNGQKYPKDGNRAVILLDAFCRLLGRG